MLFNEACCRIHIVTCEKHINERRVLIYTRNENYGRTLGLKVPRVIEFVVAIQHLIDNYCFLRCRWAGARGSSASCLGTNQSFVANRLTEPLAVYYHEPWIDEPFVTQSRWSILCYSQHCALYSQYVRCGWLQQGWGRWVMNDLRGYSSNNLDKGWWGGNPVCNT